MEFALHPKAGGAMGNRKVGKWVPAPPTDYTRKPRAPGHQPHVNHVAGIVVSIVVAMYQHQVIMFTWNHADWRP
jgi:hypothetical protein